MPIAKSNEVVLNMLGASPNTKNVKDGPPFAGIEFNDGGDEEAGEEKNIKVATANIAVNKVISGERAERAAEVHPRIEFHDSGDDNSEHHCE
jgi:hypothetical protein